MVDFINGKIVRGVAYAWNDYYADCCLEFVRRDYVTCCDGGLPL